MKATRLLGLPPQRYEHPLDRSALDTLEGTPGLEMLVRKCNEWGIERLLRIEYTGNHLRTTPDGFPELYDLVGRLCDVLDLPKRPEAYLRRSEELTAATIGVDQPIVVVSSAAVDHLEDDELAFVVGRELGHIKSGHSLYRQMADFLPYLGAVVDATPLVGKAITAGLRLALLNWHRISEFTADRAGLLATQNPDAVFRALIKIAGLPEKYAAAGINSADFIAQAREFQSLDNDTMSWFLKGLIVMQRSHPWTVARAHELIAWIDSGDYERIVSAAPRIDESSTFCIRCGCRLEPGSLFCQICGWPAAPAATSA